MTMNSKWAVAAAAVAAATIGAAALAAMSSPDPDAPAYDLADDGRGYLVAVVETDDPGELRAVADDVRADHRDGDGWHLAIDCRWGATPGAAVRLANAQWADTPLGAARTGLQVGEITHDPTGRRCERPAG